MKEFKEKWRNDSRFRAKIKLLAYSAFVLLVAIFAISNRASSPSEDLLNQNDVEAPTEKKEIQIPNEYNYIKQITINEEIYEYVGTKNTKTENISKTSDNIITKYIYENNSYYKEENGEYLLVSKEEVYDKVNYNYLNLETINEYLSKAKQEGNQYLVYLKDIILGNDSDNHIIITINDNKINIDYTSLMKHFDSNITKYLVRIEIQELE